MKNRNLCMTGGITRQDNRQPVHGLLVEASIAFSSAWEEDSTCTFHIGCDLTNRDGSFSIPLRLDRFDPACTCKENPEVYLKIRDRDGRVIYNARKKTDTCQPGNPFDFHLSLDADDLACHLSRPLSWKRPDEPLLPANVLDETREAIELITPPGKPGYAARLNAIVCAEPQISVFDSILRDAWDTLQGDLSAAARYRDILEALCACHADACCTKNDGGYAQIIDRVFDDKCESDPCKPVKLTQESECCQRDEAPPCPCQETLISSEKVAILIMAALHVASRHKKTAKVYLAALLDQLCRFQYLGALHRSAVAALCGDTDARSHFRDLVEFIGSKCQSGDQCASVFPKLDPLPCCETCLTVEVEHCLRDAYRNWCSIHAYLVTEVNPARACPGDTIVICGCGFGDKPGRVVFYQKGSLKLGPAVIAESWSEDRICVVVPEGAGCSLVLELPADTVNVCDRFLEHHATGCIKKGFEGTSPEILKFIVKDHINNECLLPGEPLNIRWKTCATDRVKVEILNAQTGQIIGTLNPAEARGKWDFTATNFNETTHVTVKITAEGQCKPNKVDRSITLIFQKPADLSIDGMEITQAIQYYRADEHLTDPTDRGADNSLQLVTNKTAWVRVYLRSGQDPTFDNGQVPDVDGTLTVERRVNNVWGVVAVLPSQNSPVTAEDTFVNYDTERRNINNTLNFVVPANQMTGLLRFRADVSSPFVKCGNGNDTALSTVNVNLQQTLNAAFITIGYNGLNAAGNANLNLPAPTLAQCQAETSWAMTTYPVSGAANVRVAGSFITNTPLNDPRSCPGCCSPNWQPLLQQVVLFVAADQAANPGTNWAYYGIINNGIPVNVPGCNGWGATGGLAGRPLTYAHEIGHQFGLPHARCGNVGNGNAAYPVYEPYDSPADPAGTTAWTMASIGEYGLDINNGSIANPNNAEDFMSYCTPRWISLYTHNFLVNAAGLVPQVIPTGDGSAAERTIQDAEFNEFVRDSSIIEPLIHMMGIVDENGEVQVTNVSRIDTRYLIGNGQPTDYIAQLLDEDGSIITQDVLYAYEEEGCKSTQDKGSCSECGKPKNFLFKAMLNDVAPGECLQIVKCKETVWQRRRPLNPPTLSKVRATLGKDGNVKISWGCKTEPDTQEDIWVRWSSDDGKTWNALAVGLSGNSANLGTQPLASGQIRFQILAHDGFSTVSEISEAVTIAPKPPIVSILYPSETDIVYADTRVHLWGLATNFTDQEISDDQYSWYIDEENVGQGRDIWVENPGAGSHKLRLMVSDDKGEGSASCVMTMVSVSGE